MPAATTMLAKSLPCAIAALASALCQAAALPPDITRQLPPGYEVITYATGALTSDKRADYLVALKTKNEEELASKQSDGSPARPLLIFTQNPDRSTYRLAKRNDHVVYGIHDGGQCDPFDGEDALAIKNQYFTVQNSVSCGSHWTDYITFKHDPAAHDWVFSKRIFEGWRLNSSNKPNTDALVRDYRKVWPGDAKHPTLFEAYRPVEH